MAVYIQGIGSISAQRTPQSNQWDWKTIEQNPAPCSEPDYTGLIAPMQLRRMSKAVKMGIAASQMALQDAQITLPDIILTGTSYGCIADTEFFLTKLIQQEEQMLTPTSFIQSTHNTVSGQIALHLKCHGRNFTYTQRAHSFEHALQDAILSLQEDAQQQILVGAMDEISKRSHAIMGRFGTFKQSNETFFTSSKGTFAGEGAQMFVLNNERRPNSYAELVDIHTCYGTDVSSSLTSFLQRNQIHPDVTLLGLNGDERYDPMLREEMNNIPSKAFYTYKNFGGEQPIAAAFACMMAASMLRYGSDIQPFQGEAISPETILIWNHYKYQYHSFILLRKP